MAVAGLGASQRVLGPLGVCDIAERGDRSNQRTVHAKRPARHGHVPLFACFVIDDARFVALRLAGQDLILSRRDVGPLGRDYVFRDQLTDHVIHLPAEQLRAGLVRREDAAIHPGDHDGVRQRGDNVGCRL